MHLFTGIRLSMQSMQGLVGLVWSRVPKSVDVMTTGLFVILTFVTTVPARAGGGMGSIKVVSYTNTSITIGWIDPDGIDYRYCGDQIKICYKELNDGDPELACGNGGFNFVSTITPAHFVVVSGLSSSTRYKFKVFVQAEKKNWRGNWKNCEWRKVGTLKQKTNAAPATPHIDNLAVTGADQFTIAATAKTNHAGDFDMIRVGYKRTWTHWLLHNTIKQRSDPADEWGERDPRRGWIDMPASSVVAFEIDSLDACRQYKLVAYGFRPGVEIGELLGEANGRTGASCKTFDISAMVVDNHEDILQSYATALHAFYCATAASGSLSGTSPGGCDTTIVFSHVAAEHPELYDDYTTMIAEGDFFHSDYETIEYLEQRDGEVFDEWQSDLFGADMQLNQYLEREYPAAYALLLQETTGPELPTGAPVSKWVSLVIGSFVLLIGGSLLWRRS